MLKIEEGKYYKTRDGRKVGPINRGNSNNPAWYWTAPQLPDELCGSEWHEDGQFWPKGHTNWTQKSSGLDLIAEWTDGPVVTETVTKTRIVPGVYDRVFVGEGPHSRKVAVAITGPRLDDEIRAWSLNPDELDAAAAVLSALAKGLRDVD